MKSRVFLLGIVACLSGWLAVGPVHAGSAEDCKMRFKQQVAACADAAMANPARSPSDYSFWKDCTDRYKGELDACTGGGGDRSASTGASTMQPPAGCAAAKVAIDWILVKDAGARQSYNSAIARGRTVLEALIYAQRHNPNAQADLQACPGWAESYARALGAGQSLGAAAPQPPQQQETDLNCVILGPPTNDFAQMTAKGFNQWHWTIPVRQTCRAPVRVRFCLHQNNGFVKKAEHTYGPGFTQMDVVEFYVPYDLPGPDPIWVKCRPGDPCDIGC